MKYIVTGGAGFVGSNLTDALVAQGHEVLVVDNLSTGKLSNLQCKHVFAYEDIRHFNLNNYREFMDSAAIFHLAAMPRIQPSFTDPVGTMSINVQGTINILDQALLCNIPVIYAGSSSFYYDVYANPYCFAKWQGEECCKMYNAVYCLPVAIARFFNVYGPRHLSEGKYATVVAIFEQQKKQGKKLTVTGNGEQRRDFTHIDDIVAGLIAISQDKWNGEIFNLGSGTNYSINELAGMFNAEIEYIPARPGEADTTLADISLSRQRLDWAPKKSLKQYVKGFINA
jgi:UDP-glucose 4-epimerase